MRRALFCFVAFSGGNHSGAIGEAPDMARGQPPDIAFGFEETDMAGLNPPNACGSTNPTCTELTFQPPFKLSSDPNPDPTVRSDGLARDSDGFLVLDNGQIRFDWVWVALTNDWGRGTVSKVHPGKVREVARYLSVTCRSNPRGNKSQCDGDSGCCARDDFPRFLARQAKEPEPGRQAVQLMNNAPSRTAVDWNGDVWVANRAFGGQSSVTKIANQLKDCVQRNQVPGIQTSSDANDDGVIDTDCNRNGQPDDLDDVAMKPCEPGHPQEFFGLDDECVLFTTNVDGNNATGRPLALSPNVLGTPSDAWPGTYNGKRFFRVDGTTGLTKAMVQLPNECGNPYGAAVDAAGVLWTGLLGSGRVCYLDTRKPEAGGRVVRDPTWGQASGYGITMDRDQNVWLGNGATRYTPKRGGTFDELGQGVWTGIMGVSSAGIAADSRNARDYFVWLGSGNDVVRIEASKIPVPKFDERINTNVLKIPTAGAYGVGLDAAQNVWAVGHSSGAVVTRVKVDANGNPTPPDIMGGVNFQGCPIGAGDRCTLGLDPVGRPSAYTYSDFTGFGLRNFSRPSGTYRQLVASKCEVETEWVRVEWDAEVPTDTSLTVKWRAGNTPDPNFAPGWDPWSKDEKISPVALGTARGDVPSYMLVEFTLSSLDIKKTPRLKGFRVLYQCRTGE